MTNLVRIVARDVRAEPEILPLILAVSSAIGMGVVAGVHKLLRGPDISLDHVHYNYEKTLRDQGKISDRLLLV